MATMEQFRMDIENGPGKCCPFSNGSSWDRPTMTAVFEEEQDAVGLTLHQLSDDDPGGHRAGWVTFGGFFFLPPVWCDHDFLVQCFLVSGVCVPGSM